MGRILFFAAAVLLLTTGCSQDTIRIKTDAELLRDGGQEGVAALEAGADQEVLTEGGAAEAALPEAGQDSQVSPDKSKAADAHADSSLDKAKEASAQ
jgi:hypothetical protein